MKTRLNDVINWSGLTISAFIIEIGIDKDEFINLMEENIEIIEDIEDIETKAYHIATIICDSFPEINIDWLCSQDDDFIYSYSDNDTPYRRLEMLRTKEEVAEDIYNNMLYRIYDKGFNEYRSDEIFDDALSVYCHEGCNDYFTIKLTDDALYPYYRKDGIFLLKEISLYALSNGLYYIVTENFIGVRCVHVKSDGRITLKAMLRERNIIINANEIIHIYGVCGTINMGRAFSRG